MKYFSKAKTFSTIIYLTFSINFIENFKIQAQEVPCSENNSSKDYQAFKNWSMFSFSKRLTTIFDQGPKSDEELRKYAQIKLSNSKNPQLGETLFQRLQRIGPAYTIFVKDPAIIDKFDRFEVFATNEENYNNKINQWIENSFFNLVDTNFQKRFRSSLKIKVALDPLQVRKAFSNQLGEVIFYRGLALTVDELNLIKRNGINSLSERNSGLSNSIEFRNPLEPQPLLPVPSHNQTDIRPWSYLLERRIQGWNPGKDPFMSITKNPDIAISVAQRFTQNQTQRRSEIPSKNAYLFKLKLPAIDIIEGRPLNANPHHPLAVSGPVYHPHVESFTFYHISPSEIEEIQGPFTKEKNNNSLTEEDVSLHPDLK